MTRVAVIVLDGVGAGALPDAADYGDMGSDTLRHVLEATGVALPNLSALGLGEIVGPLGAPSGTEEEEAVSAAGDSSGGADGAGGGGSAAGAARHAAVAPRPGATYGRLLERGAGKDTTAGHWELMGLVVERPFPTYPEGFPADVIEPFERAVGLRVLANRPASGTAIIEELGDEHVASGRPIVYTSADSVFQIACHEGVVPIERLYEWCAVARRILSGEHAVGRVIARPFTGASGAYVRTERRRDFALPPAGPTYLDLLQERGLPVVGVGKIGEIFAQRGVDVDDHTTSNADGLLACERHLGEMDEGLLFANLVDFDMVYGHRNDAEGFARGLAAVDAFVPRLEARLRAGDVLVFCADHGVDPTTASTDHSREYAPLMALGLCGGRYDGAFSDVGATAFAALTAEAPPLAGRPIPLGGRA